MLEPKALFPGFFVLWIALGVAGFYFFHVEKDAARKRLYFPRFMIGAGALFALVVALLIPWPAVLLFLPFVALITWMNIRMTRFCSACGKTIVNQQWWTKMRYCPYCGEKLPE